MDALPDGPQWDLRRPISICAPQARWFIAGPTVLPRRAPEERRVDRYHLGSLAAGRSLRRRGTSGVAEWKIRLLDPERVRVSGLRGSVEHWCRFTVELDEVMDPEAWIDVDKWIWRDGEGEAELVALRARDEIWSSVSLCLSPRHPPRLPRRLARMIAEANGGLMMGYPAWLLGVAASH